MTKFLAIILGTIFRRNNDHKANHMLEEMNKGGICLNIFVHM